ncbi:MAG: stage V sporulation protein AD [Clostridiales bacterium]|jgi:stage V sporulation protein AD|nr:stage V sporulation protein AD [Clostridiales bacterium]
MGKHVGEQSIKYDKPPQIIATATVVGPKEGEGPLARYFDKILPDVKIDSDTWESAESGLAKQGVELAVAKAGLNLADIQYIFAGDLLNQGIGSTYGIRSLERPYFGLFAACSTIGEAMTLGGAFVDGGFAERIVVAVSSHFCAAEKTFRFPLGMGNQRTPTSSWTVTGDGAYVIQQHDASKQSPAIVGSTAGKIVDFGIKDLTNMGAAMAPAAADTIIRHFEDFNTRPSDYDMIITGDLGHYGYELLKKLLADKGFDITGNSTDCGIEIFDKEQQDTHAGGSGPACSAITLAAYFLPKLQRGEIKRVLFVPTGALMNATSAAQGETIPCIAHAVVIESGVREKH